ncbi:SRPBCC family protein [Microlunatus soli]|uniref:SRPBCC family protein n=1 Tax=Microlunatus soli TaxID=630515 RepID=UPI000B82D09C|nr:SRPBCC family protein [Microlunatus soli]
MQGSVTVPMRADADKIWALLSDPTRIGRYSPETFEGEWTHGSTGPEVGARFRGHVRRNGRGPVYWTPCVVTDSVPGRRFEFAVGRADRPVIRWGYELTPTADGTDVREYFAAVPSRLLNVYWAIVGRARTRTNLRDMRATLERIRAEVE